MEEGSTCLLESAQQEHITVTNKQQHMTLLRFDPVFPGKLYNYISGNNC